MEGWRDDFLDREVKWREANLYLVTAKVVKPATEMRLLLIIIIMIRQIVITIFVLSLLL